MKEYIFLSIEMDIYGKLFAVFLGIHQQQKHEVDIHKEEENQKAEEQKKQWGMRTQIGFTVKGTKQKEIDVITILRQNWNY